MIATLDTMIAELETELAAIMGTISIARTEAQRARSAAIASALSHLDSAREILA